MTRRRQGFFQAWFPGLPLAGLLFVFAVLTGSPSAGAADRLAERFVLDNGMVVLHSERHGLPIVRVSLGIRAGSVEDGPEKAGLAGMTAALVTEGTTTRSARDLRRTIEFVGGSIDVSAGGDFATASLTVLKKDVDVGFALLADVLRNPSFPTAEIERVRERILGGIRRKAEEPGVVAEEAFLKQIFGDHPYGTPVEGTPDSVSRITADDIRAFHQAYYRPNRAWMAAVGDLSRKELDALLDTYFVTWQASGTAEPTVAAPPAPSQVTLTIDRDLSQANIRVGHLGVPRSHPDYYALSVMNYILGGGGFSSRLMDTIRDNLGLAYSVYSSLNPGADAGYFMVSVETKNASTFTVLDEIDRQIRAIRNEPVTEKELEDAKAYLVGSFPRRLDSTAKIAPFLLAVEFYGLGLDYPQRYPALINAVTREDVLRVAREHLHPETLTRVIVGKRAALGGGPAE